MITVSVRNYDLLRPYNLAIDWQMMCAQQARPRFKLEPAAERVAGQLVKE